MKKLIIIVICMILNITYSQAQCPNGDAEMNNFDNWQAYTGTNTTGTLNLSTFTQGFVPNQHTVTNVGNDPIVGASLPMVAEGNHAFRLGNTGSSYGSEIMSYTFTAGSSFSFMYALVLQGAHSVPGVNGFFSYWISTTNDLASSTAPGNLVSNPVQINANASDPFFRTMTYVGQPLTWKEWQTQCSAIPAQYVGQQLTIYFATADCSEGGHFGYAYIDAVCKPVPAVPVLNGPSVVCNINDPILFDGSATLNESQYVWTYQECDAAGNPIGNAPFGLIQNGPVGTYSPQSLFSNLQNGHYYRITLMVRNCGSTWVTTSKIVKIDYPVIQASNKVICCGSNVSLTANVTSPGSGVISNYKWYDQAGNFVGNGTLSFSGPIGGPFIATNKIDVTPTRCTSYRLVFEQNGCKNEKWVYVTLIKSSATGVFSCVTYNNCTGSGTIKYNPWIKLCGTESELGTDYNFHMQQAINNIKYSWSTGSTSDTSNVTGNNTYTVTITSVCGTSTASVKPPVFNGAFPGLFKPTAMSVTNPFIIYNTLMNQFVTPAYNAYSYELSVYDRWGTRVYYKYETTCLGFYNGQIKWDGRYTPDANGNPGPYVNIPGVYTWNLKLTNCSGSQTFVGDVSFIQ